MPVNAPKRFVVCFTGFSPQENDELADLAYSAKHHITGSITRQLTLLVIGKQASSKQLEQATSHGIGLATGDQYRDLVRAEIEKKS